MFRTSLLFLLLSSLVGFSPAAHAERRARIRVAAPRAKAAKRARTPDATSLFAGARDTLMDRIDQRLIGSSTKAELAEAVARSVMSFVKRSTGFGLPRGWSLIASERILRSRQVSGGIDTWGAVKLATEFAAETLATKRR